jgi:hypothetical protein
MTFNLWATVLTIYGSVVVGVGLAYRNYLAAITGAILIAVGLKL